jgi:LysM repeat protein
VRNGDTLAIIASRYGCTVEMIEKYNRIPNRHRIAPGQKLTVPQRIQ